MTHTKIEGREDENFSEKTQKIQKPRRATGALRRHTNQPHSGHSHTNNRILVTHTLTDTLVTDKIEITF